MKKYRKIILAGGSGYLGRVLTEYYKDKADEIIILSRHAAPWQGNVKTIVWDGRSAGHWAAELVNADMLINLCGKNVNCRYTEKNKAEIFRSRLEPTEILGQVIGNLYEPPKLWINLSSATIYRHAEDRPQDEYTGEHGEGFSVDVCEDWEYTFNKFNLPKTRKIALRMGIVLGRGGSVFPRLLNLVRLGFGGRQGNGRQMVSWLHELDATRCTEFLLNHPDLDGIFNVTAPNPVSNAELMHTLRNCYGAPFGLPAPKWLLDIGAAIIGTETELMLKSRWVLPRRLLEAGFKFKFPDVGKAISNLLNPAAPIGAPSQKSVNNGQFTIYRQ